MKRVFIVVVGVVFATRSLCAAKKRVVCGGRGGEKEQKMERRKKHILNIDFCNVDGIYIPFPWSCLVVLGYQRATREGAHNGEQQQRKGRKGPIRRRV